MPGYIKVFLDYFFYLFQVHEQIFKLCYQRTLHLKKFAVIWIQIDDRMSNKGDHNAPP